MTPTPRISHSEPMRQNWGVTTVFLLWHQHDPDKEGMLLGVYSTMEVAEKRRSEAIKLPGFRRYPDDFVIDPYEIDRHEWPEGFATMIPDGTWVDDQEPSGNASD